MHIKIRPRSLQCKLFAITPVSSKVVQFYMAPYQNIWVFSTDLSAYVCSLLVSAHMFYKKKDFICAEPSSESSLMFMLLTIVVFCQFGKFAKCALKRPASPHPLAPRPPEYSLVFVTLAYMF